MARKIKLKTYTVEAKFVVVANVIVKAQNQEQALAIAKTCSNLIIERFEDCDNGTAAMKLAHFDEYPEEIVDWDCPMTSDNPVAVKIKK